MRKNLVLTPLMVALAAGVTFAQDTSSAVLTGKVTSARDNRPLANVRIRIESPSMLGARPATTDSGGNFRVPLLPNGEYSVLYTLDGYITRKLTMRLVAGQTANASVKLSPMTTQEATVEISAEHTQLDKTDTVAQTSFSTEFLEKVVGRNLVALGALAPGISNNDLSTQGTLNIRGGTGHSTKTLLNGSNITEMYGGYIISTFSIQDLVESVALIQSPINSRYGNSDGGILTMVTSKGSNTFTGSFRITGIGRSYWSVLDEGYERRDGLLSSPNPTISTTDLLSKGYEISVKGPLWKDHITFAYGGRLTPNSYSTPLVSATNGDGVLWNTVIAGETPYWSTSNRGRPGDKVGTYYEDPDTGAIIRKPEMWLYNTPEGAFNTVGSSVYNQFTVFFQITPQHQLEYNFAQTQGITQDVSGYYASQSGESWNTQDIGNQTWNMVYKGIIGTFGVLDVSYGKTFQYWKYGDGSETYPIRSWSMASRVPMDGNRNNHNPSNYHSNGFIEAEISSAINTSNYNLNYGFRNQLHNGINVDSWDGGGTEALVINYQHLLNTGGNGSHMFDVGIQSDKFQWFKKAGGPRQFFDVPGTIAKDLTMADIYNPRGANINPSNYAGKYIVFNVATATLGDVDPYGCAKYGIDPTRRFADYILRGQGPLLTAAGAATWGGSNFTPRVQLREGEYDGTYNTNMMSYYLNDLWSINDNHSLQAGVRIDNFDLVESSNSIFSYIQPTFRFEYKWDIHGDQSRVLNASWAQFHSMQPAGLFTPMINAAGANNRYLYWGVGESRPYLVDKSDLINLDNYTLEAPSTAANALMYEADSDWKAPISSEFQLGLRRNLSLGGYWKITFVYRSWINDFDYYPGDIFDNVSVNTLGQEVHQLNIKRVLKNSEGYERKYTGVELEWDYPIGKRVTFGGSYTFNRLISNTPERTDSSGSNEVGATPAMNFDTYWDYVTGGRDEWRPTRVRNPEHYFKWYLLFDFTSGKVDSSLAFRGAYTSGTINNRGWYYQYGYPTDFDPRYQQLISGTSGGNVANTSGTAGFSNGLYILNKPSLNTRQDIWTLNLRYMITVPVSRKIHWMGTIDVSNPFNHRRIGDNSGNWFSASGADTPIIPYTLTGGGGTVIPYNIYSPDNSPYNGVWRSNYGAQGNPGQYTAHMAGRSFSVQTGLRF